MEVRFSAPAQTGPEAHPASCTRGTGFFPGVKSDLILLFQHTQIRDPLSGSSGPGSVVAIATGYGMDGPEIEYRWR
jgi:hypothetical protein